MPDIGSKALKFGRLCPLIAQVGPAVAAALLTWGVAGTAMAAGLSSSSPLSPLIMGTGMQSGVEQGCSSMVDYVLGLTLIWDSMLFDAQAPACGGFRAFDIAFMAVVALIVISAIRFRHAATRRRLELARRMVEKGIEPPAELVGASNGSDLRRGLVLVCTGIGLLLASMVEPNETLSSAGLIPGFIGIGYLISHRFAICTDSRTDRRTDGRADGRQP